MNWLTIIYPTHDCNQDLLIWQSIAEYQEQTKEIEFIVIYKSGTPPEDLGPNVNCIQNNSNSRGERLNIGLEFASSEYLVFHHPRSILGPNSINELKEDFSRGTQWGGWTHRFDKSGFWLSFTSWYSNNVRADLHQIFYLDHCIFAQKKLMIRIGGFPKDEIFEDTLVSERLKNLAPAKRLKTKSTTSSIRFEKNGFWSQSFLNMKLKRKFRQSRKTSGLNEVYEKNISLNSKY